VKYLLDTCTLSELVKTLPDVHVLRWIAASNPLHLFTSAMTLAELHRGVNRLPVSKRRTELSQWLQNLEISFEDRVLAFDSKVAKVWAEMTVEAEIHGKPMASFDSIIAATARANGCRLVTRNTRDFMNAGLEVINPWANE
jgi:predicted nucleic acid-binding protein